MRLTPRAAVSLAAAAAALAAATLLAVGSPALAGVTAVPLTTGTAADIVVDNAHQRVYISFADSNQVLVRALNGAAVTAVTGLDKPWELALSPDGAYVYVVESGLTSSIARISTADHSVSRIDLATECPKSLTVTGGRVWFGYRACDGSSGGIGVIDSAAGTATTFVTGTVYTPHRIRAVPDHPERVALTGMAGEVAVYDVSSGTPTEVVRGQVDGVTNCQDAGVFAGGTRLVFACGAPYEHRVWDTADLSAEGAFPSDSYPNSVAVTADGRYVAAGIDGSYDPDVYVYDTQSGVPGTFLRNFDFGTGRNLHPSALAWGANGWLYAVASTYNGPATLHILTDGSGPEPEPVPSPSPSPAPPKPKVYLGPLSAVLVNLPSGSQRVLVTGTVTCDKDTDTAINGDVYQSPTGMSVAFTANAYCRAGSTRTWYAVLPIDYSALLRPIWTDVSARARALHPDFGSYAATGSTTFVMQQRHTSPFGRKA